MPIVSVEKSSEVIIVKSNYDWLRIPQILKIIIVSFKILFRGVWCFSLWKTLTMKIIMMINIDRELDGQEKVKFSRILLMVYI